MVPEPTLWWGGSDRQRTESIARNLSAVGIKKEGQRLDCKIIGADEDCKRGVGWVEIVLVCNEQVNLLADVLKVTV